MRPRHLHIESDSALLARIRECVTKMLVPDRRKFTALLIAKLVIYLGGSCVLYAALFLTHSSFWFVSFYILLGLFLLLLAFNFAHDLSHNTVFSSKQLNHLGFAFIYSLVGAHAEAWRERHVNSHHFAPNVKAYDSDLQITNLIRVTPEIAHKWYHLLQPVYAPLAYTTYSLYWILIKDVRLLLEKFKREGFSLRYLASFILQKTFYFSYILLLPLLFSAQSAGIVVLAFVLMHLVQSVVLLLTFFMTHHVMSTTYPSANEEGIIQTSWLMNQVRSSNDMHPFSQVANFILGGFNNHIAHHLFPNVHHVYYPELSMILYGILEAHGVQPNRTTYWGGIASHFELLRKLSRGNAYAQ